jgi:malonyl-CoA decarboxylase
MNQNLISRGLTRVSSLWRPTPNKPAAKPSEPSTPLPPKQVRDLRTRLSDCAREVGGQVTARTRAAALGDTYRAFDDGGKLEFLCLLAHDFGPDPKLVEQAHAGYAAAIGTPEQWQKEVALRSAVASPRSKILTQFNALPDGLKFLVDLRADLLRFRDRHPGLAVLDCELREQLASWFDVGFLQVERITWNSPAALLEKLIQYEAVHAIASWGDLRNRLDSDRRCYAFFHPRMPMEPLIFVEVALTSQLSDNIRDLLDEHAPVLNPDKADTAIFYSISNTQDGLRGVSLGNFLLKRVIDELKRDLPRLNTFATLSPIVHFRTWVDQWLAGGSHEPLKLEDLRKLAAVTGGKPARATLRGVLKDGKFTEGDALSDAVREPLAKLAAFYLIEQKKGNLPVDGVARFHLGNGARVERLNWLADVSARGLKQSYGMMVNYRYIPAEMEENIDGFTREGRVAAVSAIRKLARS